MISHIHQLDTICGKIDEALNDWVPFHSKCAILDFPDYGNVGDSAIWLGQIQYLYKRRSKIVYRSKDYSYSKLKKAIGNGIIFIQGGGNFGDLWESHQNLRHRLLKDFPENQIIQFPQSIFFQNTDRAKESFKIINNHKNFFMAVRDETSLRFFRQNSPHPVVLCPDMAYCLTLPISEHPSALELLGVFRGDKEKLHSPFPYSFPLEDWTKDTLEFPVNPKLVPRYIEFTFSGKFRDPQDLLDLRALQRLKRGCTLLNKGQIIATDRLHAHILCTLMAKRHVLLDNSYGKNFAFSSTWTRDLNGHLFVNDPKEVSSALEKVSLSSPRLAPPSIIVFIPTLGRTDLLRKTLESLSSCKKPPNYKGCLVIENGPKNGVEALVLEYSEKLNTRYAYEEKIGLSRALNKCLELTGDDFIIFTNDDVTVNEGFLEAYCLAIQGKYRGFFFGGPVQVDNEISIDSSIQDLLPPSSKGWSFNDNADFPRFIGPNWACFASDARRVGGFNILLGLGAELNCTGEEKDIQDRFIKSGMEMIFVSEAKVTHFVPTNKNQISWFLNRRRMNGIATAIQNPFIPIQEILLFGIKSLVWLILSVPLFNKRLFIKALSNLSFYLGIIEIKWKNYLLNLQTEQ